MKKSTTHCGTVRNNRTGEMTKVLLRKTKHCWVSMTGKRFLKTTGHPPGLYIEGKELLPFTLLVETIVEKP